MLLQGSLPDKERLLYIQFQFCLHPYLVLCPLACNIFFYKSSSPIRCVSLYGAGNHISDSSTSCSSLPPFIHRCHRSVVLLLFSTKKWFRISCPLFAYLTPGLSKRNPTRHSPRPLLSDGGFTHGFFFAVKTFPPPGTLCPGSIYTVFCEVLDLIQ